MVTIERNSGSILKSLRKKANKTQLDLSNDIGKSRSYISRIENDKAQLNTNELSIILDSLNSEYNEFMAMVKTKKFIDSLESVSAFENGYTEENPGNINTLDKNKILEILKNYFEDKPIKKVYLFGSVARDEHDENSDIDILIEFMDDYKATLFDIIEIKQSLEDLTSYNVDVITKGTEYPHVKADMQNDKILVYGQKKT